jgi:hypothetical protein
LGHGDRSGWQGGRETVGGQVSEGDWTIAFVGQGLDSGNSPLNSTVSNAKRKASK